MKKTTLNDVCYVVRSPQDRNKFIVVRRVNGIETPISAREWKLYNSAWQHADRKNKKREQVA